jgi:hypothetical protein
MGPATRRGTRVGAAVGDPSLQFACGGTVVTKRAATRALLSIAFGVGGFSCSASDELGPAETVEHVAHGLADGDLTVAWEALPASYQRDLNGLSHDFAAAVDADLWNRTFAVLSKLTRLLKEKEAFILEHPFVAEHLAEAADDNADWSVVVELFDLLVTSELAKVEQLAALEIGSFLEGTGNRFVALVIEASALSSAEQRAEFDEQQATLRSLRATLESTNDGVAVVRIEQPGEDASTENFVRVEEKWIPADLVEKWSSSMASARDSIKELSEETLKSNKQAILMQMSMVDSALDTLLAANTAEEFNAGIGAMIGMAVGAMFNPTSMMNTSASSQEGGFEAPVVTMLPIDSAGSPASISEDVISEAPQEAVAEAEVQSAPSVPLVQESIRAPQRDEAASAGSQIPIAEASRYIGQTLRVSASDGLAMSAKLKDIDGDVLVFEQKVGGGAMTFKLRSHEVESLRTR